MRGRSVKEVDIVVVGAGPIGGYFARRMAELNCTVLILEEHLEIGKPFQCAGLVNPAAMERVDLYDTILSEIDGAIMHSPYGTTIKIGEPNKVRTYTVCRKKFDQGVVQQALEKGAELWLNCKPTDTEYNEDSIFIKANRGNDLVEIKAKLLVGA